MGAGVFIAISLAGILFGHYWISALKMSTFVAFYGAFFLCDVMSNPSQNLKCNILPHTMSHVNNFDEIKGSNLNRIRLIYVSAKQITY